MRFVIDAQPPPALAEWLVARGHEAAHVLALAGLDAPDSMIWDLARHQGRTVITKDRDFAIWASARRTGPQVVWIRLGNTTTRALLAWLEPKWPAVEARLDEGVHLVELRA